MFSNFRLFTKFVNHFFKAFGWKGHGIHSPFIFHFITGVLNNKQQFPSYKMVEELRTKLINNKTVITVDDYGAGSVISNKKDRAISSIAIHAAKPKKFGQLLFRMVQAYQPSVILEIGTSLGITTSYLSLAKPDAKIITLEGARQVADIACDNFNLLNLKNITQIDGNFDQTLVKVLNEVLSVDFVFIDGNHRKEPTLHYFDLLLKKKNNNTVFVFDDIHWSKEMESAWEGIKKNPEVRVTVDLFFIGIVFFRKEFLEKQHFTIRF